MSLEAELSYFIRELSNLRKFNVDLILIDIDECASIPCQNGGRCVDQVNMYTCYCASGFQGIACQTSEIPK